LVSKILVNPKIKLGIDFFFFPQISPAHWPPHPWALACRPAQTDTTLAHLASQPAWPKQPTIQPHLLPPTEAGCCHHRRYAQAPLARDVLHYSTTTPNVISPLNRPVKAAMNTIKLTTVSFIGVPSTSPCHHDSILAIGAAEGLVTGAAEGLAPAKLYAVHGASPW
jgi:hypothetical protein